VRQWKDRRVTLEMPLFPGYVFVHLPFAERVKVVSLPNVVGLIGSKSAPSIVSASEIDCIRRGVEFGNAAPHAALVEGQRVVIVDGVLRGVQGILLRSQNNTRVVVAVDSIARSFAVEVDISCLKPAGGILAQERRAV
jgi:transcription antitermination factor NusG